MHSLFLLILLIPQRLLKLIPLSYPQTHLLFLTFIYLPVISQIPSRWLSVTPPIPPPTRWLLPRTLYWPLSIYQKEVQACCQEGPPSYWRTTWEVLHRVQNHQQPTQQLAGTQPQPTAILTHQPLPPERRDQLNKNHPGSFLWPAERDLMHNVMLAHDTGFAWSEGERGCKGTSVHFLTSPLFSYSSPVHMYSISSPLYHLQELHSKADDLRTHSLTTLQKSTPGRRRLPDSPPAHTLAASDEPRTHWDRSVWHYSTLCRHVDTHSWEAWW
jgi:hypothetical protein